MTGERVKTHGQNKNCRIEVRGRKIPRVKRKPGYTVIRTSDVPKVLDRLPKPIQNPKEGWVTSGVPHFCPDDVSHCCDSTGKGSYGDELRMTLHPTTILNLRTQKPNSSYSCKSTEN